ncbi:MAG TPA: HYR domain-containing protein, partial [Myxococcales bacterium]|nr:HYR domain-containing protein [Myxococcales bacterium]
MPRTPAALPQTLPLLLLALLLGLATTTPLPAQVASPFTLRAGDAEVIAGGSVEVPIYLDVNTTVGASNVTFGFIYSDIFDLTSVSQGFALAGLNGGDGAFQFLIDTQESTGDPNSNPSTPSGAPSGYKGATLQLQIPDKNLTDFLTLGADQEIAILHFTDGSNIPSVFSAIEFTSTLSGPLGPPIGDVFIEVIDATLPPDPPGTYDETGNPPGVSTVEGSVLVIPPPVINFTCGQIDDCLCLVGLSWTNAYSYDELSLYSNGIDPGNLIASLAGTATDYPVTQTVSTTYFLVGVANGMVSNPIECSDFSTCSLTDITPPVIVGMPEDIQLKTDAGICSTTVSWPEPTSTDNCDGAVVPIYVVTEDGIPVSPSNGEMWFSGNYIVSYTATDASGNTANESFSVTVNVPLGDDCNLNGQHDACDLSQGTEADCNANGIPDSCDISEGTEFDCDLDGVPDSCRGGSAFDCNNNGIPDECAF